MGECVQVRLLKQGDLSDIVSIHMHAFEVLWAILF